MIELLNVDCMEYMATVPDKYFDLMITDPPYGITACAWDDKIDLSGLWKQWERIVKDNGALIFTSKQPFTTDLINSKRDIFRYELIWFKDRATGFLNANKMPMPNHENILVFYKSQPTYNPQKYSGNKSHSMGKTANTQSKTSVYGDFVRQENTDDIKMPKSVLYFPQPFPQVHPTQKPVDLFRYLIRTYSNEGDNIFDGYMGSGTAALACNIENRCFIGCETDKEYYDVALRRFNTHKLQQTLAF